MKVEDFLHLVSMDKVPPEPPDIPDRIEDALQSKIDWFHAKRSVNIRGMWAIVNKRMAQSMADILRGISPNPSVLEIMSGRGWLTKALRDEGITVVSTDNHSWKVTHSNLPPITDVKHLGAVASIRKYGQQSDVLLVSWPPMSRAAYSAAKEWGSKKPIIYIGESAWGCTADNNFWEHFTWGKPLDVAGFKSWPSIHDRIYLGNYK